MAAMTDAYDYDGSRFQRGCTADFNTLPRRVMEMLEAIPGFKNNTELLDHMTQARIMYDRGNYREAYTHLAVSVERLPTFKACMYHYIRICHRVLAVPLTSEEKQYEAQVQRYASRPGWVRTLDERALRYFGRSKWIRRLASVPLFKIRCKWCGRYTPYISPATPTFGLAAADNCCRDCGRTYPIPSWLWDSPDGRAYSYYRMSFKDEAFYEEFERDYDPAPHCRRRVDVEFRV